MRNKPITPYERLMKEHQDFRWKVKYPKVLEMWHYPKARLADRWSLVDLNERVAAASTLGYDVQLYATDQGLEVKYVQKRPE